MASTIRQRDVLKDALHALSELFRCSAPDAWLGMRKDYGELYRRLESAERECVKLESQRDQQIAADRERMRAWRQVPRVEKQHWIMNAVDGGPCTMRDLTARVQDAQAEFRVYEAYLKPIVNEMVKLGNLEKISTGGRGSQPKWRYQLPVATDEVARLEDAIAKVA